MMVLAFVLSFDHPPPRGTTRVSSSAGSVVDKGQELDCPGGGRLRTEREIVGLCHGGNGEARLSSGTSGELHALGTGLPSVSAGLLSAASVAGGSGQWSPAAGRAMIW